MTNGEIDATAAQAYEDHLVPTLFAPWARCVVEMAAPGPGETVLDIACGTGIGARLAAPFLSPGGRVISADSDPAMIMVARATAGHSDLPPDVELDWQAIPAETKIAETASIDLCLCLQGPQFVTDRLAAMTQVFHALKPGGRLAASMWNEFPTATGHYAIGQALLARGLEPALKPFSLGEPDAAKALFRDAGLRLEQFVTEHKIVRFASASAFVDGVAAGAPATRHALARLAPDDLAAFVSDVEDRLAGYRTSDGLHLPTSAHLVLARRPQADTVSLKR